MESKRQLQVAALIKRNFSAVLQQEGNYIYQDALVTVTNVKVTPDLSLAKIYLSIYNTDNKQAVLLKLEDQHYRLKQIFSQRIRKHIRRIPEISMFIDETLDEMYRVDALLERLGQQASSSTKEEE
jgi:ribosome-binding factor A